MGFCPKQELPWASVQRRGCPWGAAEWPRWGLQDGRKGNQLGTCYWCDIEGYAGMSMTVTMGA